MVLLQFIDIKIVGYRQTHAGQAKIYGFFAVRETTDPSRNYVYRRGIENCEYVSLKQKTVNISVQSVLCVGLQLSVGHFVILKDTSIMIKLDFAMSRFL